MANIPKLRFREFRLRYIHTMEGSQAESTICYKGCEEGNIVIPAVLDFIARIFIVMAYPLIILGIRMLLPDNTLSLLIAICAALPCVYPLAKFLYYGLYRLSYYNDITRMK